MNNAIVELVSIPEASRRLRVSAQLLRRRVASQNVQPDAVMLEGSTGQSTMLFVAPRIAELRKLAAGSLRGVEVVS